MYEHHFSLGWNGDAHNIQHHRLYIDGSGDGISGARLRGVDGILVEIL